MRDHACALSFGEWHSSHPADPVWTYVGWTNNSETTLSINWDQLSTTATAIGCCDSCFIVGGDVDVYYWPVPGSNNGCTSAIGTSSIDPDFGVFTTDDRGNKIFESQPNPYPTNNTPQNLIYSPSQNIQRLAYSSQGPFRNYSTLTNKSMPITETPSGSIAIVGNYTFTSPSIYVGFSDLGAEDRCGTLGSVVGYTILAFAPGELSTIEAPRWMRSNIPANLTKSFNFADLPCPPQRIMAADQYRPSPGEPYRPVLAAPSKLSQLQSGWSNCALNVNFEGIDPPRSLTPVPARGLVPATTQVSIADTKEIAQPAQTIFLSQPKPTESPDRQESPGGLQQSSSRAADPASTEPSAAWDPNIGQEYPPMGGVAYLQAESNVLSQQSSQSTDGSTTPSASSKESFDPDNVSPNEMSALKQALQLSASAQPSAGKQASNENVNQIVPSEQLEGSVSTSQPPNSPANPAKPSGGREGAQADSPGAAAAPSDIPNSEELNSTVEASPTVEARPTVEASPTVEVGSTLEAGSTVGGGPAVEAEGSHPAFSSPPVASGAVSNSANYDDLESKTSNVGAEVESLSPNTDTTPSALDGASTSTSGSSGDGKVGAVFGTAFVDTLNGVVMTESGGIGNNAFSTDVPASSTDQANPLSTSGWQAEGQAGGETESDGHYDVSGGNSHPTVVVDGTSMTSVSSSSAAVTWTTVLSGTVGIAVTTETAANGRSGGQTS